MRMQLSSSSLSALRGCGWIVLLSGALLGLARPCQASICTQQEQVTGASLVSTSVFASVDAIQAGEPFELAIRYRMKPHWHIYWQNAGGSGMPPNIDVVAPDGFQIGAVRWPTPEVFPGAEPSYGYSGETVLLVPVTPPATIKSTSVEITVGLDWLVCKTACLFGNRSHTLRLPVTEDDRSVESEHQGLFETWRKRMPVPAKSITGMTLRLDGENLLMEGPLTGARLVWFYPGDTPGVMPTRPGPIKGRLANGRFQFDIPLRIEPDNAPDGELKITGIVVPIPVESGRTMPPISVHLPIPTSESHSSGATTSGTNASAAGS